MKVYESAPHPESPNMYCIKNRAQRFYRPHAASSRLPETIYNLAPRSTIWIRYDSQGSVSLQASSSSKFVWLWKFHVKIWGLDTQIWFWILWQSSYRLGTMTIGACYTSSKSFLRTTKSRNFSPEKSWFAQFCSPLQAVEVRSSVVLLPCVLGSMAYLPQYSHREPSIKLGFWKGRRQSLEAKPQLIKSENHVAACDPLETSTRCWQREEFVRMEVIWTFLDPYRVLYITIASFVFDWSFKQNVCFLKNSLLLILLWFWFIFLSQMLHRWSCQSRRLGVSLCSEWPIFCTCLHNVSTKTRS